MYIRKNDSTKNKKKTMTIRTRKAATLTHQQARQQ